MSHDTPRHKAIAGDGQILLTEVGSGLHGVAISGTDDHDEMGVCIPPPPCVIGLEPFEQYQDRWHADGTRIPEGTRSHAGDTDHVTYALAKWARLAAAGNPTVLMPLFAPEKSVQFINPAGTWLRDNKHLFITKQAGERFQGYLGAQKERMLGLRGRVHTNRPELVAQFGFDTKCGYHALRLAKQGIELMNTGKITLPMAAEDVSYLRDVRRGKHSLEEVVDELECMTFGLNYATGVSNLPDAPDYEALDEFLVDIHHEWWDLKGWL